MTSIKGVEQALKSKILFKISKICLLTKSKHIELGKRGFIFVFPPSIFLLQHWAHFFSPNPANILNDYVFRNGVFAERKTNTVLA